MTICSEDLRKVSLALEEASERHASALEEGERVAHFSAPSRSVTPASNNCKSRRRGSICISRFGELSESQSHGPNSPRRLSTIAASSSIYQAQAANMSIASFASGASDLSDENVHIEDLHQVTQVQQIAGKHERITKAVSIILPRRLSRTNSVNILTPSAEANLVIGVSVQESTTEVSDDEAELGTKVTVSAPGNFPRNRSAGRSRSASSVSGANLFAKAKSFTQKLKRRDRSSFLQNTPL